MIRTTLILPLCLFAMGPALANESFPLPFPLGVERPVAAPAAVTTQGRPDTSSVLGCILEPSSTVEVSAPVAGVISSVPVKRGDAVRKGRVIFKLGAGVEAAAVDLARVKANFAERKTDRNQELFQDELLSPHEKDEIETEMLIAQMELKLKEQELALRTVYSPISGVVTDTFYNQGEYVTTDPILSIAALDPLHVDILLPSSLFGQVRVGQRLVVKPDEPVGGEHEAEVTIVDPIIDPASGTFRAQLLLDNPDLLMPAGLRCSITLDGGK